MPYVPSKKTDGKSMDREILDKALEAVAQEAALKITNNLSLIKVYEDVFLGTSETIDCLLTDSSPEPSKYPASVVSLATAIYELGKGYGYEGAFLGELNYTFTRFIQRVPQIKVKSGQWKDEIRYWLYAATVEALTNTARRTEEYGNGTSGVFEDIKDEYKRRVNPAYEAAQILKSGDCYDTPYYNRLVELVGEDGKRVGHILVDMVRSEETLKKDVLDEQIVLKNKEK